MLETCHACVLNGREHLLDKKKKHKPPHNQNPTLKKTCGLSRVSAGPASDLQRGLQQLICSLALG